jgi:hypothetical protein
MSPGGPVPHAAARPHAATTATPRPDPAPAPPADVNVPVLFLLIFALAVHLAIALLYGLATLLTRAVIRDCDRRAPGIREPAQLYRYDSELGCVPLEPRA